MAITHVLVVVDGTQDNTMQGITEALEALPSLGSASLIVTDSVQSAITILAETSCTTDEDLSQKSGLRRLNS